MKVIGPDFIEYWEDVSSTKHVEKSRFGIRVEKNLCWPLVQLGEDPACSFGSAQQLPMDLETLPAYLTVIVEARGSDSFDLLDILSGRKSFRQARKSGHEPNGSE